MLESLLMAWILQVDQRQKKPRQDTFKIQLNHGNKKMFSSENAQVL